MSAIIKQHIEQEELDAISTIFVAHKNNSLELVTSDVVKQEINNLPTEYLQEHKDIFDTFKNIPVAEKSYFLYSTSKWASYRS